MGEPIEFNPNYDDRDLTQENLANKRKIYSNEFYLVLPGFSKIISYKSEQTFSIYVRKLGEVFGDALAPLFEQMDVFEIRFYKDSKLVNVLPAAITNSDIGELSCEFDKWTFPEKGIYSFKVKVNETIIDNMFQIIVK